MSRYKCYRLYLFHDFPIINVIFNNNYMRAGDHTQNEERSMSSRINHLILNSVTAGCKKKLIKKKINIKSKAIKKKNNLMIHNH